MDQPVSSNGHAEVARINSLVRRTRLLLRSSWVAIGAGLTIGLGLGTVVATTLVDLLVGLPTGLRLAACLVIVVPTLMALVTGVVRPAVRRLSSNQVARKIEREIPKIQSRLVTTIDLATQADQRQHSPAFFERLVAETIERVGKFRPGSVLDRANLLRSAVFAAGAVVAFGVSVGVFGDRLAVALARVLSPFADIPPASGVVYRAEPGDAKVLKGEDLTIAAVVGEGANWFDPEQPERQMVLEYRTRGGKWSSEPMTRTAEDRFEFTIQQLSTPIEYRLVGGRTWTLKHSVDVIERPAIAELHTVLRYPAYMKLPQPKLGPPQTGEASGPVGSDVEVVAAVAGDVASGEIEILTPVTRMRPVKERRERVWFEGTLPAGAKPDGNWQWDHALKFRAAHTEPPAAGPHGHGFSGTSASLEVQPGEYLYTNVFIVPGQVPEEIMLQWHDGTNWEHRAYWGTDKIQAGAPNTPSRMQMGELPAAGDWVLLEVPAKALGLEGKKISGMSFMLFGGQCKWNRAGTINPPEVPERSFVVERTYPMQRTTAQADGNATTGNVSTPQRLNASTSLWSGHVPLERDTLYRARFVNELGHANKEMRESKLMATPDNPPQLTLERPGTDLVLSAPQKVPLVVRAYDDFGLADISLAVQKGDSGGFVGEPLRTFDDPVRSESLVASLDLAAYQLKVGEHVRYRMQARDRKGQIAQTQEFVVRIAADNNAADKQLAAIEQQQDTFQKKLLELIAGQAKVTEAVAQLAGRERPADATQQALAGAPRDPTAIRPAPVGTAKTEPAKAAPNQPTPPNDPAAAAALQQKMAELRKELEKLAPQQDANLQVGTQLQAALTQLANQAAASRLMPEEMAAQMRAVEQAFQNMALQPMRDALQAMRQAADPKQPNPDANALAEMTEQIQQQLEALRPRMEALAKAQQNMRNDPADALAQLRADLMEQNAQLASREVEELKDFIERLMGQLKMLEGKENELARQTKDVLPSLLPEVETEQMKIEAEAAKLLAQAERLREADKLADMKRRRRMPEFPDAPYTPDGEEQMFTPAEEDTEEPESDEMKGANDAGKAAEKSKDESEEEEEEMFIPPTGVRQKLDPRFAKKMRPVPKKGTAKATDDVRPRANDQRGQLMQRQQQTAQQLRDSQRQLQPRRDQLAQLMQQLQQALGLESAEAAQELAEMMESMGLQQALAMAQAMRQSQAQRQAAQGQPTAQAQAQQPQAGPTQALLQTIATSPNAGLRIADQFGENDIDLAGQTIILRMQPRLREELLKGMREEGPEGYRKFIQDYFNRLTKVKSAQ